MRSRPIRPTFVAIALGLTVLLVAMLTFEAVSTARYHRATAERVLADYAALGAESVAARIEGFLASRFSGMLMAIGDPSSPMLRSRAELARALSGPSRDALLRAGRIIRIDRRRDPPELSGGPFALGEADSILDRALSGTRSLPGYAYFGLAWLGGGTELLAYQPARDGGLAGAVIYPRDSLVALVRPMLAGVPVLPASLTKGADVDSGIGVRLVGGGGTLVDRRFDPGTPFIATHPLSPMFGNLAVEVSLRESLAPKLIIGGLPRSRIPISLALLGLTMVVLGAAAYQLRRERELGRLREDFVASVSHELRTPLAQIRLFAETLRLGRVRSEAEGARSLSIVEHEAKRLEHLVENLLHFSNAEQGRLTIHLEPTDLTALVEQVVTDFAPLSERAECTIALDASPRIEANVDRAAVRQILLNLLDNAVKYGPARQTVTVRLCRHQSGLRLTVEDRGAGVPDEAKALVWERFWRSETAPESGSRSFEIWWRSTAARRRSRTDPRTARGS